MMGEPWSSLPTPDTDAAMRELWDDDVLTVRADFCRSLERRHSYVLGLLQEWSDDFGCGCNSDTCTMCKTRSCLASLRGEA